MGRVAVEFGDPISDGDGGHWTVVAGATRLALLAGPLVLAGCSSVDRAYHAIADPVQTAFVDIRHDISARASAPPAAHHESRTATQPPPAPALTPERTPETTPVPTPVPTPVVVDGLSAKAVRTLLGQPAAKDGPAPGETWTYRSGPCEVHLFLFPDVTHGGMQVLDHRVSGAGSGTDDQQACLRQVRSDRSN